jgi:DNA-binding CsgD family transcriptional regulator
MGAGNSLTEIAAALSLSVKTISTYRARMLEKLGLKSSTEIIQYAIQNRLVPPE